MNVQYNTQRMQHENLLELRGNSEFKKGVKEKSKPNSFAMDKKRGRLTLGWRELREFPSNMRKHAPIVKELDLSNNLIQFGRN